MRVWSGGLFNSLFLPINLKIGGKGVFVTLTTEILGMGDGEGVWIFGEKVWDWWLNIVWFFLLLFCEEAVMSRGASVEHRRSIVGACMEHTRSMQGAYKGTWGALVGVLPVLGG